VKLLKLRFLPRRGVYELKLEDGEKLLASPDSIGEFQEGEELSTALVSRLRYESAYLGVRETAIRALGRREHFTREISDKLRRKLVSDDVVQRVISELQRDGYLDDNRAAEVFIKERLGRGSHGPFRIISELVRKGYPKDAAREAVRRLMPGSYEEEMLSRFVRKYARSFREKLKREEDKLLLDGERVRKMGGPAGVERHLRAKHMERIRAKLVAAGFNSELCSRAAREIILGRRD
jgi:SOS response regulatory protein OraA/RecX